MVVLLFLLFSLPIFCDVPVKDSAGVSEINNALDNLMSKSEEDQAAIFHNHNTKFKTKGVATLNRNNPEIDYSKEDINYMIENNFSQANSDHVVKLFNQLDPIEKNNALRQEMKDYDDKGKQSQVYTLLPNTNYTDILTKKHEVLELAVKDQLRPTYCEVLPLIHSVNAAAMPRFYDSTAKLSIMSEERFHEFNTFEQLCIYLNPYTYFMRSDRSNNTSPFDLSGLGLTLGCDYTFFEKLTAGLGFCIARSELHWCHSNDLTRSLSLYIGPYIGYLFSNGSISLTLIGSLNQIKAERTIHFLMETFKSSRERTTQFSNYILTPRLEAMFSKELGEGFYIWPSISLDYINVFSSNFVEVFDEKSHLDVKCPTYSFLNTRILLELKKEILSPSVGLITPQLQLGWTPPPLGLNSYNFQYKITNPQERLVGWDEYFPCSDKLKNKLRYHIGPGLNFIFKKGIYLSMQYTFSWGKETTQNQLSIRVSTSW